MWGVWDCEINGFWLFWLLLFMLLWSILIIILAVIWFGELKTKRFHLGLEWFIIPVKTEGISKRFLNDIKEI